MIAGFDPLFGLDSLIAAFLLSPWIPSPALRLRLAAWFGLADGIATLTGALLPPGLPEWVWVAGVVAILASDR